MNTCDKLDEVLKLVDQTLALTVVTSSNDQFLSLNGETQMNLLWLLSDNLCRAKKILEQAH